MDAPTSESACREVIASWKKLSELADFAESRRGYGNSNGGFGVVYPGDLDAYDLATGHAIPDGMVEVYAYTSAIPPGFEWVVSERDYLSVLADVLDECRLADAANRVRTVLCNVQRK